MPSLRFFTLSVLAVFVTSTLFAPAYIKFDGIDGEATDKDHKQWINVDSVADLPAPPTTREAGSGMATGRRTHKPVKFVKPVDRTSPQLAAARAAKTVYPTLTLSHDGRKYTLTNARIATIQTQGNRETITLTFDDVTVTDEANPPRASTGVSQQAQGAAPANREKPRAEPSNTSP